MEDAVQQPSAPKPNETSARPGNTPGGGDTGKAHPGAQRPAAQKGSRKLKPPVNAARMKRRHWGLALSFLLMVIAPFVVVSSYLSLVAEDQYGSTAGFIVRSEESSSASELLGGLAQIAGGSVSSDGDILYEFILSQPLIRTVEERVGLREHYSAHWGSDPAFALWPDASIEDLEWFWRRVVRVSYDQSSGLTELRVQAFDPDTAQQIAQAILDESQKVINALNDQARADALRYATSDLDEAVARLKTAREALTAFRSRTQIVDPDSDLEGRMGVLSSLQQQLAQALIEYDLLREQASESDPRVTQAQRTIAAIRGRIAEERRNVATENPETGADGRDYPELLAEYEGLMVDREYAEQSYRAALASLDVAKAQALRQSRYLATYLAPTLAETSEYPRRLTLAGLTGLFLLLAWGTLALVYYSIRDRA